MGFAAVFGVSVTQGAFLFEAVITAPQGCYIALSMMGGFLYSYTKFAEKKARDKAAAEELPK